MADEITTHFNLTHVTSPRAGRLAVLTMDNGHDHTKPTTFGEAALTSLDAALDAIEGDVDVRGVLLTGKPFIFAVGADLTQFTGMDADSARAAGAEGHRAFGRLRDLQVPTLAAINGACMGGGLEIALHCDARTLSDAAAAIAFPEVFLSILPAWGGTQLTPRLIGAEAAVEAIIRNPLNTNRMMKPPQVAEIGLADRLVGAADFVEHSLVALEDLVTGEWTPERPSPSTDGLDELLTATRAFIDDKVHGATDAPYRALDLIEHAARGGDLAEGLAAEEDALAELLPARQAQASVYAFELTQTRVKRQPWKPDAEARSITEVAVVGSGLMGAQLGSLFLQRFQVPVVMKDIDQGVLDAARSHIEGDLDGRVLRGRMDGGRATFLKSLVTYTTDDADLAGADFVIEAVAESMDLKRRIMADVERVVDPGAVLATNTSSLSVEGMAADLDHPERVVGFHFFNPVAILPLVEVVRTPTSSDEAMATAFHVSKTLRKSAVQCADTPAFVVNRLLTRFMGACGEAVNEGADFADVDDAVKALGLPMGPFELLGLVGLPVAAHVAQTMHEAYPDRFALDENFQMLGRSGLDGIYDPEQPRQPHPAIRDAWEVDADATAPDADAIRDRALRAIADEIGHMLDEGVVADARDIDTCMLLGAGWPFFTGGICMYLDQVGLSEEVAGRRFVGNEDQAG